MKAAIILPLTYVNYSLRGAVREEQKVQCVIVVVGEGGVDGLHEELGTAGDLVRSEVRAVNVGITSIIST